MKHDFLGITWNGWEYIIWFPLVGVAFLLIVWTVRKRLHILTLLADPRWRTLLFKHISSSKLIAKAMLYTIGSVLLFCALLRPVGAKNEERVEQHGRDVVIALDVSRSMLAQDRAPNRLDFAKQKIRSLLKQISSERIGLIIFSGSAIVQCPLTTDYGAFYLFLDQLDAETISSGTTALDEALKKALTLFASASDRKNKLLVLLTDGEDFSSNLAQIKQQAIDQGLHIFALGVGTPEGAPVPLLDEAGKQIGHQRDAADNVVISRLNEGILRSLADQSGGSYLYASDNTADIMQLSQQVKKFEQEKFADKTITTYSEWYPFVLAGSLTCFALEWLL